MTKFQIGLVSIIGFVLLVAVVLLILAPCLGHANIIEMFKSWTGTTTTPQPEEVVETAKLIINSLRI